MAASVVEIFTDGACSGNPGPGGWGVLLRLGETEKELWGGERETTNNRMELTAVIRALEALKRPVVATLTTDSRYVRDGITQWLPAWKARGWRTAAKKPVKNDDLWRRLDAVAAVHDVDWRWVRGHAGPSGKRAGRCPGAPRPCRGVGLTGDVTGGGRARPGSNGVECPECGILGDHQADAAAEEPADTWSTGPAWGSDCRCNT